MLDDQPAAYAEHQGQSAANQDDKRSRGQLCCDLRPVVDEPCRS